MKIMKNGRLFGLINIIDLLALLLVVLVIAGVGYSLLGSKAQDIVNPDVEMLATMRIRGAMPHLYDELVASDKRIVSGNSFLDAEVVSVEKIPYVVQTSTSEGVIVDATDPTKVDIIIVVKAYVSQGTPSPKIGAQEVRTGRTYTLKTQTFECNANIDSVVFAK